MEKKAVKQLFVFTFLLLFFLNTNKVKANLGSCKISIYALDYKQIHFELMRTTKSQTTIELFDNYFIVSTKIPKLSKTGEHIQGFKELKQQIRDNIIFSPSNDGPILKNETKINIGKNQDVYLNTKIYFNIELLEKLSSDYLLSDFTTEFQIDIDQKIFSDMKISSIYLFFISNKLPLSTVLKSKTPKINFKTPLFYKNLNNESFSILYIPTDSEFPTDNLLNKEILKICGSTLNLAIKHEQIEDLLGIKLSRENINLGTSPFNLKDYYCNVAGSHGFITNHVERYINYSFLDLLIEFNEVKLDENKKPILSALGKDNLKASILSFSETYYSPKVDNK